MHNWLSNAIKHQDQTNACIKQHAKPGPGAKFRFAVSTTKPNVFETTKSKIQAQQKDDIHSQYIKPSEVSGDKCLCCFKKSTY